MSDRSVRLRNVYISGESDAWRTVVELLSIAAQAQVQLQSSQPIVVTPFNARVSIVRGITVSPCLWMVMNKHEVYLSTHHSALKDK